jgi:cell wall assembly regulator SMI1
VRRRRDGPAESAWARLAEWPARELGRSAAGRFVPENCLMEHYWNQIESLFQVRLLKGYHRYFVPGASEKAINGLERHIGLQLPNDFKTFYRIRDGQGKGVYGLVFGLELLSIRRIKQEWGNWNDLGDDLNVELAPAMSSEPKGYVKPLYLNPQWIPFTTDQTGTHLGMDFDPDKKGIVGQIIAFGRNENKKKILAKSFRDYIHLFVKQLQTLDWTLDEGGWEIRHKKYGKRHYHDWLKGQLRALAEAAGSG